MGATGLTFQDVNGRTADAHRRIDLAQDVDGFLADPGR
jgi:hypothetical protein